MNAIRKGRWLALLFMLPIGIAAADRWTHFLPLEEVFKMKYDLRTSTYWFGTANNGLYRYDGQQFVHVPLPPNPDGIEVKRVDALAIERDTLWVGTSLGLYGYHVKSGNWRFYNFGAVTALFSDTSQALWYGTGNGQIGKKTPAGWEAFLLPGRRQINAIAQDRKGNMYFGANAVGLCVLDKASRWTCLEALNTQTIRSIALDRKGYKWLGTLGGVFLLDQNNQVAQSFTPANTDSGLINQRVHAVWIDAFQDGDIKWFGTSGGVSVLDSTNRRWKVFRNQNSGLAANSVRDIIGDGDGNLWLGLLEASGANRFNHNWAELTTADTLQNNFVFAVEKDRRGRLWVGTRAGGLQILHNGVWKKPFGALCPAVFVTDFVPDDRGMWVTTRECGAFLVSDSLMIKDWIGSNYQAGFPSDNNVSSLLARGDTVWAGTDQGFVQVLRSRQTATILVDTNVLAFVRDGQGHFWIGTDQGLCRFDGKTCDVAGLPSYVRNVAINALACDRAGVIWVGTNFGLARFDGANWTHFTTRDGLPDEKIAAVGVAPDGTIWCGTPNGAAAFAQNRWTAYTTNDGLSDNFILDLSFGPPDVVWFATWGGGVARYRRTELHPNTYILDDFAVVTAPNITIHYSGYDFNTPAANLRYQYALDDTNKPSPITPATFAELFIEKSRSYNFYVRAIDKDDNMDPTWAQLRFAKINSHQGGALTIADSSRLPKTGSLSLYMPPGILQPGISLRLQPIDTAALPLSEPEKKRLAGFAYALGPAGALLESSRPLTLKIIYGDSISSLYSQQALNERKLAIYAYEKKWERIGGTVDAKQHAITTTIVQLDTIALFEELETLETKSSRQSAQGFADLAAQPRMFSPAGDVFAKNVAISFDLEAAGAVTIKVYNLAGRLVKSLCENQMMNAGHNAVNWDGYDYHPQMCPSGMYLICLQAAGKTATKTVMVVNQ